jgi:hypothetical protein
MLRLGMLLASMLLWQSQRASIEGTVRNSSTNAPLATVSVELTWVEVETFLPPQDTNSSSEEPGCAPPRMGSGIQESPGDPLHSHPESTEPTFRSMCKL